MADCSVSGVVGASFSSRDVIVTTPDYVTTSLTIRNDMHSPTDTASGRDNELAGHVGHAFAQSTDSNIALSDVASQELANIVNEPIQCPSKMEVYSDVDHRSIDEAKLTTPETQSIKCSLIHSSLHSMRQVKCRKTGHRRMTANAANLRIGQLINAVSEISESCLNESTSLSVVDNRVITPVKAPSSYDSNVVEDKLARHFDRDSTGCPLSNESQGAQQVVDGIRRPPKARKSCHSNDNRATLQIPSDSIGTSFGTVRLAELVDAQSLDKLDVRSLDEMLFTKMRERVRPSSSFKLLLHNNEQSQAQTSALSYVDNTLHDEGRGTPLIPSTAKTANLYDSLPMSTLTRRDDERVSCTSEVSTQSGHSIRQRVWRCRKTNSSPGSVVESAGSRLNRALREKCDMPVETQPTRKSPRCSKHSPSSQQHVDQVGNCILVCISFIMHCMLKVHSVCLSMSC